MKEKFALFRKSKYFISVLSILIVITGITMYGIYMIKLSQALNTRSRGSLKETEPVIKTKDKKDIETNDSPSYLVQEESTQEQSIQVAQEDDQVQGSVLPEEDIASPEPDEEAQEEGEIPDTNTGTNTSCPLSTQSCVPCYKDELYCRYEEGEDYGYLGWACQNNNPGNVKYSEYRVNLIVGMGGTEPCGEKGTFMVFSDYKTGRNSVKAYIRAINAGNHYAYPECGNCSLLYFFDKYAANQDYAYKIEETMGGTVTVNTKLSWIVANRFNDFIDAIQYREGWITQ